MLAALRWVLVGAGVLAAAGTALSLVRSPHWFFRSWDFPRVQLALVALLSGAGYAALYFGGGSWEWLFLAALAAAVAWQGVRIWPYTPMAPNRVQRSEKVRWKEPGEPAAPCFTLLISNVLMENREHHRLLRVVREHRPDVVLTVETDASWALALGPLRKEYPYTVEQPQDNYYGMMLFSRLPLADAQVRFLVQPDIPSIHATLQMPGGATFELHGLHPRPPEPIRDQDSTPRDAELVLMGRAIGEGPDRPTIVAGDLNDVAWSATSRLFLRLSGLLDPRMGRGFYNSYNANNPLLRFPLDHVFHSNEFRLVHLQRLPNVGSDHFPILIVLSYEPEAQVEQPETERHEGDLEEAEEKVEEQVEAARTGDDRPGRE